MTIREGKTKHLGGRTAAPAFHVSDTIDWSSLSAQIKNRTKIVRIPRSVTQRIDTPLPISEHRSNRTTNPTLSHSKLGENNPT